MKNLIISFSGGRTSAFMTKYIFENDLYKNYKKHVIFMNTSAEKLETLDFVNECDKRWNLNIIWLEAKINHQKNIGTEHTIVNYDTAHRDKEIFEEMIKKYGIPNIVFKHCTRELKIRPLTSYLKSIGVSDYITALGIRADEPNRLHRNEKFIYPIADEIRTTKSFIRNWWNRQDFDLKIKDYEGNCDLCYKKSERKKYTIIRENPDVSKRWIAMEEKYSTDYKKEGTFYFHRNNKSTKQLVEESMLFPISDFAKDYNESKHQTNINDYLLDLEFDCLCKSA